MPCNLWLLSTCQTQSAFKQICEPIERANRTEKRRTRRQQAKEKWRAFSCTGLAAQREPAAVAHKRRKMMTPWRKLRKETAGHGSLTAPPVRTASASTT